MAGLFQAKTHQAEPHQAKTDIRTKLAINISKKIIMKIREFFVIIVASIFESADPL